MGVSVVKTGRCFREQYSNIDHLNNRLGLRRDVNVDRGSRLNEVSMERDRKLQAGSYPDVYDTGKTQRTGKHGHFQRLLALECSQYTELQ